jgi:hypothetical protein
MGLRFVLGALVAITVALLSPSVASACSIIAQCVPPVRLFPAGPIPGNLVYFKVLAEGVPLPMLRTQTGEVVSASVRVIGSDRVFAPDNDLPPGQTFVLHYTTVCPFPAVVGGPTPSPQTFGFTTSAPATPPGPVRGELAELDSGSEISDLGGQTELIVFARARFTAPAPAGVAHLLEHHLTIDGRWTRLALEAGAATVEVRSYCDEYLFAESSCGDVLMYPRGEHEIEAWSTIVGAGESAEHLRLRVRTTGAACSEGCSLGRARDGTHGVGELLLGCLLFLGLVSSSRRLA